MKLSLCITTYNRYVMTIESFAQVLNDDRIDDIVIMDDCSQRQVKYDFYSWMLRTNSGGGKVRFIEQSQNVGMSRNKRDAIANAKNEWVIIFDSDNIIGPDYLDAFFDFCGNEDFSFEHTMKHNGKTVIYCPDFAKPNFDYTKYGKDDHPSLGIFSRIDAKDFIHENEFNCLINTCNYIVNRDFYISTYKYNKKHIASDTIWHNYNHLKAGGELMIVPGMQYFHRVHPGSGFLQDAAGNMAMAEQVRKLIQQL